RAASAGATPASAGWEPASASRTGVSVCEGSMRRRNACWFNARRTGGLAARAAPLTNFGCRAAFPLRRRHDEDPAPSPASERLPDRRSARAEPHPRRGCRQRGAGSRPDALALPRPGPRPPERRSRCAPPAGANAAGATRRARGLTAARRRLILCALGALAIAAPATADVAGPDDSLAQAFGPLQPGVTVSGAFTSPDDV